MGWLLAYHGRTNTHLLAALAEGDAGVLATLIAVMDDAIRSTLLQRHVQRRRHRKRGLKALLPEAAQVSRIA